MKQVALLLAVALLSTSGLAQVTFQRYELGDFGIDTAFGYTQNSFVDYNRDGYLDFFNGQVYLNDGTGQFSLLDSTRIAGAEIVDWGDFDNDGYPDLITNLRFGGKPNDTNYILIYRNEGPPNWVLRDVSDSMGLGYTMPFYDKDLVDPAWFDYDNDGWLDFYLTSYEYPEVAVGQPDYLFHSDSGRCFDDVSDMSQVSMFYRCSRGISLLDFDEDNDVDVFVSVYRLQPNLLWQNNSNGTFTDVATQKGVAGLYISGYYGHNIGAAVADFNNDGHMDITTPITHHPGNVGDSTGHLWISNGPPGWTFTCHWPGSGLRNTEIGSSPSVADFDNDGDLDLFYVNLYGAPGDGAWLYRNDGNCQFTDVTDSCGLGIRQGKYYAIWCDVNEDGFMDILWSWYLIWPTFAGAEFMINTGGNGNHWLEVDVAGEGGVNRSAIGTRLDVFADSLQVTREVLHNQGNHYGSMYVSRQHFGLGPRTTVDSLVIRWPNGDRMVLEDPGIDTILRIGPVVGTVDKPSIRVEPARLETRTNGYEVEVRLGNRTATVVDAAGRVCGSLLSDAEGVARWRPASTGVYFIVAQRGEEQQVAKVVLLR